MRSFFALFRKQIPLFSLSIFLCFCGAILEGLSYSFLIISFSALLHEFPVQFGYFELLQDCLGESLFIGCLICGVCSQVLKSLLCFLSSWINAVIGLKVQKKVQLEIYEKIFTLSFDVVNRFKIGELLEYIRSPLLFFRPFLENLSAFFVSSLLILVSLGFMAFLSIPLTLFTLTLFMGAVFFQKFIVKKSGSLALKLASQFETLSHHMIQTLNGLRTIHLFNGQKRIKENLSSEQKQFEKTSKNLLVTHASLVSLNEIVGIFLVSLTLLFGTYFFGRDKAALPLLLGFMTVTYRLSGKVLGMMGSLGQMATLKGYYNQMKTILNIKVAHKESGTRIALQKEIEFRHVTFRYPETKGVVIDDLSCTIKKGETIAFVGSSGGGKSSLVDLIVGLYQPSGGDILVDGHSLSTIDIDFWRGKLGVVSQETFLFNDTLEENILFGNEEGEALEAVKAANADHFIDRLPQGFKTMIGERGHRLSGGERQRVALARALVKQPEILILDEATSHLDSASERWIYDFLTKMKRKKTIIIVAHRLSTVKMADQILVVDQGRVVERGTHQELMGHKGAYHHFWELQDHV